MIILITRLHVQNNTEYRVDFKLEMINGIYLLYDSINIYQQNRPIDNLDKWFIKFYFVHFRAYPVHSNTTFNPRKVKAKRPVTLT